MCVPARSSPILSLSPRLRLCQKRGVGRVAAQVGLMLRGTVIDNIVFGGPGYNSQVCVY